MFAFRDQCGPLRPQIAFVDGYDAHFSTVLTLMKEDNIWVFFLGKSFVCPVLELREEMERHKRQKKDGLTPQQFLAADEVGRSPTAEKQKLQEAQKQVLDTEALRNSATAARKEQQLQEWAAAHGDLVLKLESMEPSAALQYFEKLTKPTLKKVLKHLEVPHENNASMGQLKDLIKGNVPACIRLIDTADME
eukprot:CAMPEP_0198211704 /NCGR_PEP_ID=MMETSP1445-20131203/25201_1 /TAXON_ID=36898 /ORGANISM="Pyramimonas sp., Strain CCMP2087" /LENGTH=191 /DNA_ID=CAMNT_0043886027 /DNA_START=109 /DNA_END=683 /DNA_ORIENTATION=+